jgi:hypothetical protein
MFLKKVRFALCSACLLLVCLPACREANTSQPEPTSVEVEQSGSDVGAITGQFSEADLQWLSDEGVVYAAPFYGDAQQEGFFLLDPTRHPHSRVAADGSFQIEQVSPGSYVLAAGPQPDQTVLVVDEHQQPRVIEVRAGQTLQLDRVLLAP